MDKTSSALLKTCSNCGLQKPLTAFLQLSESKGAIYGNICADCRKAAIDKANAPKEPYEEAGGQSGKTIDSKTKVHEEIGEKQLTKQMEAEYKEDREQMAQQEMEQKQKTDKRIKEEKKHHQHFLERRPYTGTSTNKTTTTQTLYTGEKETIDLSTGAPYRDTEIPKIRHQGDAQKRFAAWLGKDSPLAKAIGGITEKVKEVTKTKTATHTTTQTTMEKNGKEKTNQEKNLDYIEQTWKSGPGSKR